MANVTEVKTYMEKQGLTQVGPDQIQSFFKGMTKEVIDSSIVHGVKLYTATVGANEGIAMPFNYVFAEKVSGQCDLIGVKISFWLRSDESSMESASRWLISMKKPNSLLQSSLDAIVMESAD
eukprot:2744374-Pyramimonas_sp.AAC.1